MACVENIPPGNVDSEMEEGEIVDDLDDLSDISSEEEFLLRQRLQVLENYNNVLERKKAKKTNVSGLQRGALLQDLSEFSASDLEENFSTVTSKANIIVYRDLKEIKHLKPHKQKKKKDEPYNVGRPKDKKKSHRRKRLEVKVISESSEESEDEYRNKRRKLANAVALNKDKNDKTSLQERLQKMLCGTKPQERSKPTSIENNETESPEIIISLPVVPKSDNASTIIVEVQEPKQIETSENAYESIDLCTDEEASAKQDEKVTIDTDALSIDVVDSINKEKSDDGSKNDQVADSDEDLELLRQHALKTKTSKAKTDSGNQPALPSLPAKPTSEDEDSDTAELRLICLKSALLKKAIEMKQKQKLRKRLSQSSNLQDDFLLETDELLNPHQSENNTDIESVDMDIGSDADEKGKDGSIDNSKVPAEEQHIIEHQENVAQNTQKPKEDELEEDEDLLRAKLLTSLSKNLPNLVDPNALSNFEEKQIEEQVTEKTLPVPKTKIPENRIVINLGESDSEGENEATKNLTKMHMKLSEQVEFQEKLDIFLKSTRMEVEKGTLPDLVQDPLTPRTKEKFVAKSLNNLPKTEQMEYKNLVKRMAELEKIKQARQTSMSLINRVPVKDTLKPRNVSVDPTKLVVINRIEEQITLSRKKIAEESARMLKLKEEGTKLSQKYKIVANELKNIATALTFNKKEQRSVQNRLTKIRIQHQRLLNSSTNKHSKANGNILTANHPPSKLLSTTKPQKENNPKNEEYKNNFVLRSVKVSVVNHNPKEDIASNNPRVTVQLDVPSNKKVVKLPNERVVEVHNKHKQDNQDNFKVCDASLPVVEKGGGNIRTDVVLEDPRIEKTKDLDDYKSPLQALDSANWEADPNAILCPFEVGGNCKDPDCKFLHPKPLS